MRYSQAWQTGQFPVRLIPELGYKYGYPVFNFVYPLPYLVSSLFVFLGLDFGTSAKLWLAASTVLSVYLMYLALRNHASELTSALGASLYLLVPDRFLSLFVTGQLGTISSFIWPPALFYATYRLITKQDKLAKILLAISIFGIITAHLLALIMLTPILFSYALILIQDKSKPKLIWQKLIMAGFTGLLLASFYWLPAILETKLIAAGEREIVDYAGHFVSFKQLLYSPWGYGYSNPGFEDLMSFQVGLAQWLIIFIALPTLIKNILQKKPQFLSLLFLFFILLTLFLMLPASKFLWDHLPVLPKLQHPWRLLLIPMSLIPFLAALILQNFKSNWLKVGTASLIFALAFYGTRNYARPMEAARYPDNHYVSDGSLYYGSTDVSWEFMPRAVPDQPKSFSTQSLEPQLITGSASEPVSLDLFYFPMWQVKLNDKKINTFPNAQGLLSFQAPPGEQQLELKLQSTRIQKLGNALSLLGFLILFI